MRLVCMFLFWMVLSSTALSDSCLSNWNLFHNGRKEKPTVDEFIKYWKFKVKGKCYKSPEYYLYLASVLDEENDKGLMLELVDKGLNINPSYEIKARLLAIKASVVFVNQYRKEKKYNKGTEFYKKLIKEYPNQEDVFSSYALNLLYVGDTDNAMEYAFKSISLQPNSTAYIVLAEGYYLKKDYKNTVKYGELVGKYERYVYSNKNIMMAMAVSYAKLGDFEMPLMLMNILAKNSPGVEKTEQFKYNWNYINYLYNKSKEKKRGESDGE